MPIHRLLTEDAVIVAAQGKAAQAHETAERPNREFSKANAEWERAAVAAMANGDTPPPRPEAPDGSVLMQLRDDAEQARRMVDTVEAQRAPEIEEACREREAELLAEIEGMRSRLQEISTEGQELMGTVAHLDDVVGLPRRPHRGGEMDPPALLKHTAGGVGWLPA